MALHTMALYAFIHAGYCRNENQPLKQGKRKNNPMMVVANALLDGAFQHRPRRGSGVSGKKCIDDIL